MSYLGRWLSRNISNPERPITPALLDGLNIATNPTGEPIDESLAMSIPVHYCCIRVVSEDLATLPLTIFQRVRSGSSRRTVLADDHPYFSTLHDEWNPVMSSTVARQTVQAWVAGWGDGVSEIVRRGGRIELWPLRPDHLTIARRDQTVWYVVPRYDSEANPTGEYRSIHMDDVLHVPGPGFDGISGYSNAHVFAQTLGLSKRMERFDATMFGNNSRPLGILRIPRAMQNAEARRALRETWEQMQSGANENRTAVLDQAIEWQQIGLPSTDTELLNKRKFSVYDICRMHRVNPSKVFADTPATYNNREQDSIAHVVDSIRTWAYRWEQEINRKLFPQGDFYVKHNVNALMRGAFRERLEGYRIALSEGINNANEIRALDDQNPYAGGEIYRVPGNMVPADELGALPPTPPPGGNQRYYRSAEWEERAIRVRKRIERSYERLIEEAAGRFLRREVDQIRKRVRRDVTERNDAEGFRLWLVDFYERFIPQAGESISPTFLSFAEAISAEATREIGQTREPNLERFVLEFSQRATQRYAESHEGQLDQLIRDTPLPELPPVLEGRLDEWSETAAGKFADRNRVEGGSAFTKAAWVALGVLAKRWRTVGGNCSLCADLNGTVVEIEEPFVSPGDVVEGDPETTPLVVRKRHGHPPLHQGCDCTIVAS